MKYCRLCNVKDRLVTIQCVISLKVLLSLCQCPSLVKIGLVQIDNMLNQIEKILLKCGSEFFIVRNMDSIYPFTFIATCLKEMKSIYRNYFWQVYVKGSFRIVVHEIHFKLEITLQGGCVGRIEMYLNYYHVYYMYLENKNYDCEIWCIKCCTSCKKK